MERRTLFWLAAAITIALWPGVASAQSEQSNLDRFITDQLLNNVVVIDVGADTHTPTGLGFIFGRHGDTVWIVTAAHVVFPEFGRSLIADLQAAPGISVQRRNDDRFWIPVLPPQVGFGGDIAFIGVSMPLQMGPDRWREPVVVRAPDIGDELTIAGKPGEIDFGQSGGRVSGFDAAGKAQIEGLKGAEGQSGAPVATALGFVGMYIQSAGQQVIPISAIENAAHAAVLPWQLTDAPAKSIPVRLCLTVTGETGGFLSLNGPAGLVKLDDGSCVSTKSGMNRVVPVNGVLCVPSEFTLSRDAEQTERITCSINPAGIWQSRTDGFLRIKSFNESSWKINGLEQSPFGWFKGTITSEPNNLVVDAHTQFGLAVTGSLVLEPQRLSGDIIVGGSSYHLEVTR